MLDNGEDACVNSDHDHASTTIGNAAVAFASYPLLVAKIIMNLGMMETYILLPRN